MKLRYLIPVLLFSTVHGAALAQNYVLWSGGITIDEREEAPTGGTKLVFFVQSGAFLSDVRVRVKDASGKELVNVTTEGPWLILALPPGRYQVLAELPNGESRSANIDVGTEPREFGFMFSEQ